MKKSSKGKVYLVGAGPGRMDLMTLRALECLKQADVILHDRLIPKEALKLAAPHAKLIYVGKKASYHTLAQDEIDDLLVSEVKKGKVVVRLKGGDPFIFGRGAEEAERLFDEGIDFEIVPGVSSAFAAPLYAGIPLTHRRFTPNIAIITGHENPHKSGEIPYQHGVEREASSWVDWSSTAKMGTIVILMGMGNLRANMEKLMEHGKPSDTPAAVVRWGGLGKQKTIIGTVSDIADKVQAAELKAPAVIVVGGVVGLADKINWFERLPLFGKTVLITRDPIENSLLKQKLEAKAGQVIDWPSFTYEETKTSVRIKAELKRISSYDWLIFSSVRSVDFFLKKYFSIHDDYRALANVKIATIGKQTAERLKQEKLWVDLIPKKHDAISLAQATVFSRKKKLKMFIPQAADARPELESILKIRHKVFVESFYKKKFIRQDPEEVTELLSKDVDWVLFYSPSAVDSFLANFSGQQGFEFLSQTKVAAIGKTTAQYLKQKDIDCDVISSQSTTEDLVASIEALES